MGGQTLGDLWRGRAIFAPHRRPPSATTLRMLLVALIGSLASASSCDRQPGCDHDQQCKGDRICEQRRCVWPAPRGRAGLSAGAPPRAPAKATPTSARSAQVPPAPVPTRVSAAPAATAAPRAAPSPAAAPTQKGPAVGGTAPPAGSAKPSQPAAAPPPRPASAPPAATALPTPDSATDCAFAAKTLLIGSKSVGFKLTNGCGKPVQCKGRMDFYCPYRDDFSDTWVTCAVVAPGVAVDCTHKACLKLREVRLKKFKCVYATPAEGR